MFDDNKVDDDIRGCVLDNSQIMCRINVEFYIMEWQDKT